MYSVKDEVHKVSALTESLLKAEQRIAELKLKIEHLEEESNKNKVGVIKLYFQIIVLDKWPFVNLGAGCTCSGRIFQKININQILEIYFVHLLTTAIGTRHYSKQLELAGCPLDTEWYSV